MDVPFEYSWSCVSHLMSVRNSAELRAAYEEVQPKVVELGLRSGTSRPVYEGLKAIRDGAVWETLDEAQRRIVEQKLKSAEHAGVGLDGDEKERFLEISKALTVLDGPLLLLLPGMAAVSEVLGYVDDERVWPQVDRDRLRVVSLNMLVCFLATTTTLAAIIHHRQPAFVLGSAVDRAEEDAAGPVTRALSS